MRLSGAARLAGVIGWPVAQALSPRLHGYWLEELGIDGALVPLAVRAEDFSRVIDALMLAGFKGVSVTIPHKQAAFALCHDCDRAAQAAGAVNLLIFHDGGRIEGRNTDASGLAASLRESLGADALRGKTAVILGAGGAARAAVVGLDAMGTTTLHIVNRSRARADELAASLASQIRAKIVVFDRKDWSKAAKDAALVLNTTSAGMAHTPSLDIALDPLPKATVICDIVYNPLETELLKRARAARLTTLDGLGMLMHQGVPAFEAFFGATPKVSPALRRCLEEALRP